METGHIVGQSIHLANGGLGHLTFPIDSDESVTTDGNLLSSLTTDTMNGDISSPTILRIVPRPMDTAYHREISSVSQTQFETTTTYELTEPGIASSVDVESKLVSDGGEILLSNQIPMQPTITLNPWPQDIITQDISDGGYSVHSNLIPENKPISQTHVKLPVLANQNLSIPGNTTTFIQPVIINNQQKQVNNFDNLNLQTRTTQQITPRNTTINMRPLQVPFPQTNSHNPCGNSAFTLRFPLPTTLGKGVQLHLVAKGEGSFPVTDTSTDLFHNYERIPISEQVIQSSTGSGVMLFTDKTTGKNYVVPTGPASVVVNSAPDMTLNHTNYQQTTEVSINGKCDSPAIDILGNVTDPYGDLGIAEPQPVIDVNEFLNIPTPKEINTETAVQKNETVSINNNSSASILGIDGKESTVETIHETTGSMPRNLVTENIADVPTETIKSKEGSKPMVVVVSPYFNPETKESVDYQSDYDNDDREASGNEGIEEINAEISNAATGEDLIKMMALKNRRDTPEECSNASKGNGTEETIKRNTIENEGKKNKETSEETCKTRDAGKEGCNKNSNRIYLGESQIDMAIANEAEKIGATIPSESGEMRVVIPKKDGKIGGTVPSEGREMDSFIVETEQRIASIVPDSMKDFVRDIFEDEDALDKEYVQGIMNDTVPSGSNQGRDAALSPGDIAKHAVQKLANTVENIKDMELKSKSDTAVSVQVDKSQLIIINGEKKWKCNVCPKMYSSKHNLVTHLLGHCEIKPHCCMVCPKQFKQPSHLHTHMLTHRQVKAHVCTVCGKGFTQPSHLKRHTAVHMEKRPHICDICQHGFSYQSELRAHKEKHASGQNIPCEKCGNLFDSVKKLKRHLASHKNPSELTCKECGKVFVYPSQLKDHMMKHNGTRPFICAECGMDFMKEHHLRAHQFTHTGEQPFVCKVCSRNFNQKANLQRHMLIHAETKLYKCYRCDRKFSQAQVLKSHLATHENKKPFKCEECGKGFSRQHNLNGHMALHQGNKKYVCFCGASFTLKGNLNRHKNLKHGTNGEEQAVEDLAAETAAKILHTMSAKKTTSNSEETTGQREAQDGSQSISSDSQTYIIFSHPSTRSQILDPQQSDESSVNKQAEQEYEATIVFEEDSPLPKKKRKSFPSKLVSKEGKLVEVVSNDSRGNANAEGKQQKEILTPVKRKQLKPKCLPFPVSKNGDSDSGNNRNFQATQSSTRRKQKAVAKASVSTPELQDEAEQEWQGRNLEDSQSEVGNVTVASSKDASSCDISGEILADIQKDNSIVSFSNEDSNSNIDARTSFSNLLNDVIGPPVTKLP